MKNTLFTKWTSGWVCEVDGDRVSNYPTHTHTHMHTKTRKHPTQRQPTDTSAAFFFQITPLGCDRRRACPRTATVQKERDVWSDLCFRLKKGYCIFKRLTGLTIDREHVCQPLLLSERLCYLQVIWVRIVAPPGERMRNSTNRWRDIGECNVGIHRTNISNRQLVRIVETCVSLFTFMPSDPIYEAVVWSEEKTCKNSGCSSSPCVSGALTW